MSPAWAKLMSKVLTTSGRTTARLIASKPSKNVPPPRMAARRTWKRPVGTRSIRATIWPAASADGGSGALEVDGSAARGREGEVMDFSCAASGGGGGRGGPGCWGQGAGGGGGGG